MKNQSLGSLTATADENIAMHCILTPSNCTQFNKYILPTLEEKLADFCNLHWSTLSSHPILFYSGAWKTGTIPTGVEVSQLKTNLRNLPTLLITPFFKPEGGILFQINAWGIGVELETEIECAEFSYAESYKQGIDYLQEEDMKERTTEEFVPYLQCLIGYIADQYFWTNHNESPLLPTLLAMKVVNTDGMQYLNIVSGERYNNLLDVGIEESQSMPFSPEKMLSLLEGSASLWDNTTRKDKLEEIFITNAQERSEQGISSMNEAVSCELYSKEDLPFLRKFIELYQYCDYKDELSNLLEVLESIDFDYSILESTDIVYLEKLANEGNGAAMFRLGEIYEYSIGVDYDQDKSASYYKKSSNYIFTRFHDICNDKAPLINNDNVNIDGLRILYSLNVTQAIMYVAILQHKNMLCIDNADVLEILDKIEYSNHPYAYYWGAMYIRESYGREYIPSYVELLEKSANLGFLKAIKVLSEDYMSGQYLQENPERHIEYCKKAATQSDLDSIVDLGVCYASGYGVQQSKQQSLKLLKFAAELGSEEAMEFLEKII